MNNFQSQKLTQLKKKDASSIGSWDKPILNLCNKINKNPDYYTTSSCSGRINLIKAEEKKQPGLFLFRTHRKIKLKQLKEELKKAKSRVYFKQEPCILHVAAKSLDKAQELLDKAKQAGWKRSGIIASNKRFVLELISTENIIFPIINKSKILVNDNFLKLLVQESNKKLARTWEKIHKLEKFLSHSK